MQKRIRTNSASFPSARASLLRWAYVAGLAAPARHPLKFSRERRPSRRAPARRRRRRTSSAPARYDADGSLMVSATMKRGHRRGPATFFSFGSGPLPGARFVAVSATLFGKLDETQRDGAAHRLSNRRRTISVNSNAITFSASAPKIRTTVPSSALGHPGHEAADQLNPRLFEGFGPAPAAMTSPSSAPTRTSTAKAASVLAFASRLRSSSRAAPARSRALARGRERAAFAHAVANISSGHSRPGESQSARSAS